MSNIAIFFLKIIAPAMAICLATLGLETSDNNVLGWFLLVFGTAYPAGSVIYYFIRHQPFWSSTSGQKTLREESGDRSFWFILPGFLVTFFAPPIEWMTVPVILPRTQVMQVIGLVLIIFAIALRIWARTHLLSFYSGHIEITADHRLVKSGPYHLIRHPGYAGFLLLSIGICVGYSSLIGLVAILVLLVPGLAYRMHVEEHLLGEHYGSEFEQYSTKTRKIIPYIW